MPDGVFGVATPGIVGNEVLQSRDPPVRMTTAQIAQLSGYVLASQYASIQAAHTALPATGGMIILAPDTTYTLTSQLLISKPNVHLWAASWNTVIQRGAALASDMIKFTGINGIAEGFTVDGNGLVATLGTADLALNAVGCVARGLNCIASGGTTGSIAMTADDTRVTSCTITGTGLDGVGTQQYGIWANGNKRVYIDYNVISNTPIDGIGFGGTGSRVTNNVLTGCHCYTAVGGGQIVTYADATDYLIANNSIGPGGSIRSIGIELNGNGGEIVGNTIWNQKRDGIVLSSVSGYLFSGNTVLNSGQSLPHAALNIVANATKVTVTGNRFIDNQGTAATQTYAIIIDAGTGDNFNFTGNDFTGNKTGTILDASTGNAKVITDNSGIDSLIGTIASAATLTLPLNPVISLTGSATATVIAAAGCWTGRQGKFIPTGAAVFTAGATIGNTVTCVANVPLDFTFDGTKLYLG